MKPILILGAMFFAATNLLAPTTGAQAATECQAEIVKGRTSHWTYRLIDGRKCWYEGKTQIPKSELYWAGDKEPAAPAAPAAAANPPATNPQSTNAQASPPAVEEFTDPEDGSCCWPPKKEEDSFESRWRSLGIKPQN
jgi:hypothetical protein